MPVVQRSLVYDWLRHDQASLVYWCLEVLACR